jgi:hypothetical protein
MSFFAAITYLAIFLLGLGSLVIFALFLVSSWKEIRQFSEESSQDPS